MKLGDSSGGREVIEWRPVFWRRAGPCAFNRCEPFTANRGLGPGPRRSRFPS